MTKNEKLIALVALGRKLRNPKDARICRKCNRVVDAEKREHCEELTWEFRSKTLHRVPFPRNAPPIKASIPAHVINREYPYQPARFLSGGQSESNRRRH